MKPDDDALPPAGGGAADPAAFFRQLGEQTSKVLTAAEEAAREIREQARRDAAVVVADARMQAEELARAAAAERRIAEEELRRFREARAILANQIEDVRRRLEEIVLRLRTPVDAPDNAPAKSPTAGHKGEGQKPEGQRGEGAGPKSESPALKGGAPAPKGEARPGRMATASPGSENRPAPSPPPAGLAAQVGLAGEAPGADVPAGPSGPPPPRALFGGTLERVVTSEVASLVQDAGRLPGEHEGQETESPASPAAAVAGEAAAMARAQELAPEAPRPQAPGAIQERLEAVQIPTPSPSPATAGPAAEEAPVPAPAPAPARPGVPASLANGVPRTSGPGAASLGLPEFEPEPEGEDEVPAGSPQSEAFRRRTEALGDVPLAAARSLKRLLQEDQNDLLDRIRRSRGRGSFEQDILPLDVQIDRFGEGMRTVLEPAFLKGRSLGGAPNIGESPDPVGLLVAKQVVAPLRRDLARMIEPRLAAGDTVATVSERAGDVYRVWKGVRTELLGEGLAYAAFHHGLLEAWREGHVGGKRWVMSPDEADCPKDMCRTNEAAGLVGLDTSFPSGHLAPPAHGACSCTVIASAR
ncbi:MAG: hypothetical protein ACRDJU_06080 [Actinomycetota bacterium]